jgi:hypothetical protein
MAAGVVARPGLPEGRRQHPPHLKLEKSMKKQLMCAGLALASSLALAQTAPLSPPASTPNLPATPEMPSPATPPNLDPQVSGSGAVSVDSRFGSLDANADGSLSRTEASADASLRKDFKSLDKDKNGILSSQEYQVAIKSSRK